MRRERFERELGAYRDGELSRQRRQRLARRLECDPEAAERLRHGEALGQAIREAWSEGPPAPQAEVLLHGLRARLLAVDAELEGARRPGWLDRLLGAYVPRPLPVLAATAALLLAAFLLLEGGGEEPRGVEIAAWDETPGAADLVAEELPTVYALESDDPVFLYEGEGDAATVIWILTETDDDLSRLLVASEEHA